MLRKVPGWAPAAAIAVSLVLAWLNFLFTARWAAVPGALNGGRKWWYAGALLASTVLFAATFRQVGRPARVGRAPALALVAAGAATLLTALFSRLPLSLWTQIPFKDDWTELYQQTVNGVRLMHRGSVVGWNWWLLGGYPTSTDIAQSFAALALVPMTLFGEQAGYHVLHAVLFLALPGFVWWDIRHEDPEAALVAGGFAALFTAGYFATLGNSGDTNSLVGVFCVGLALVGSAAARRGRRWGGPVLLLALTLGLYSHVAFVVYAGIFLLLEAIYFRDLKAVARLVVHGQREVVADVGGPPVAGVVQRGVPRAAGLAAAAQLAVRDRALVVAGDALAVEAVPVPHRARVGLPGLPAHRVLGGHPRILEVVAPALPAAVVARGRVDDRAVRGGDVGQERGEQQQRGRRHGEHAVENGPAEPDGRRHEASRTQVRERAQQHAARCGGSCPASA